MEIKYLKGEILKIVSSQGDIHNKLQGICDVLKEKVPHFDWVGFYFKNGDKDELKLAEFSGKPTEHTLIPFGKGICGQVALSNENFVVQDVSKQDNYISCGIDVKSEIVVPVFKNGENIGQIDIDSHQKSPFTKKDEELLGFVCEKVSALID